MHQVVGLAAPFGVTHARANARSQVKQQTGQRETRAPRRTHFFGHRAAVRQRHSMVACVHDAFNGNTFNGVIAPESSRGGSENIDDDILITERRGQPQHKRTRGVTGEAWNVVSYKEYAANRWSRVSCRHCRTWRCDRSRRDEPGDARQPFRLRDEVRALRPVVERFVRSAIRLRKTRSPTAGTFQPA